MALSLLELGPTIFGDEKDLISYFQGEIQLKYNILLSIEFYF